MNKALELLNDDLTRVEDQFKVDLSSDVVLIQKVGQYILASGGKRMRPVLLLLSARLSGYRGGSHIALASVVEFIHTATLLHDDVVDDAILRRGRSSANSVWGNQASVLVGDYLFAKSFSLMVGQGNLKILQILSDATTMMAEGEVLQLISTCDVDLAEEHYITVVSNKTAILISAACQVGAVLGESDIEKEEALRLFGMDLGIAFQFMDDALDYVADQNEFGKARGHDLQEGKMTLPLIHTLRQCTDAERRRIGEIVDLEELGESELDEVCGLIEHYDGIAYTYRRAAEMVERAKGYLSVFPDSPERRALFEAADYVVTRSR